MSCKLSDKCDNVFACNVLRPNVELLGCNFYKPKKPMTNKEWLRQANTEQLAEWIVSEINETVKLALHDSELNDGDVDADYYMEDADDWVEWLKQPHHD